MKIKIVIFDKSVITDTGQLKTGTLKLNPDIWLRLLNTSENNFVLLLTGGNLNLLSKSDYEKNKLNSVKYRSVKTLSNFDVGKTIEIIEEINDLDSNISNYNGVDPVGAIAEAGGKLADVWSTLIKTLPVLGVGKKARMKEENNTTANQLTLAEEQLKLLNTSANNNKQLLFIGGAILLAGIVLFFVFKN